jgi:alpha-L-rhamnosidase
LNEVLPFAADTRLAHQAWVGQMIRPLADDGVGTRASFITKSFQLDAPAPGAQLRISALGLYRCFINGVRVGHDLLTPGWTAYDQRLSFQTYDVSALLKTGQNVVEIWLADGWLRSQMMWRQHPIYNTWGSEIAAIAELSASDGTLVLATDASWQSGGLPILKSGIYFGEIFDARLDQLVADKGTAVVAGFDTEVLLPHEARPVRELAPRFRAERRRLCGIHGARRARRQSTGRIRRNP